MNSALTNRSVFVEVGLDAIEKYRADYLFFNKLRYSVVERYDNEIDLSKYEAGIKNLLDLEDDENDVTFYTVTLVPGNNAPEKTVTCSVNSLI